MRENELEKRFCELIEQRGGKAYKFISPGNAGVPDRLVILPGGRVGFIELKRQGAMPGKLQQFRQRELSSLGCYVATVDSVEGAEAAISEMSAQTPVTHARDRLFSEMVNQAPGGRQGALL